MENLSLEEINKLIADAGSEVVAETAEFRQINASNEAQYRITYGDITNNIFVIEKDGNFVASVNTLN